MNKKKKKKILKKIPRKEFIFSEAAPSKNEFTFFFKVFAESLSNLVHDFWENCFRKRKLLLAANRLIYLNISIGISKFHSPRHPSVQ